MKILLTGANGFLGQHLCKYLSERGLKVIANGSGKQSVPAYNNLEYEQADLTDENAVVQMLDKHSPDIIIHAAAMSKPDECEMKKDLCLQVNVKATETLLKYPAELFIYISTDFVFGDTGPHTEHDPTGPLNFYGESKLKAEVLVQNSGLNFAIVRPVLIYGKQGNSTKPTFLHWVKQNLEQGKPIKVVSDQFRTPTYAPDICHAIETIIKKKKTGIFNIAGKDLITPYEMAVKTAKILNLNADLIEKVDSNTFIEPVQRAKRGGLIIEKARKELGFDPVSFEEGVRLTFED